MTDPIGHTEVRKPTARLIVAAGDVTRLRESMEDLGYELLSHDRPAVLVIDADLPNGTDLVGDAASSVDRPGRIVAFSRTLDDFSQMALSALGADVVVTADQFMESPEAFVPRLA